jgi:nucleoside-diphosphate-sugar epimerase
MKVFITGSAGFIGSHLINHLHGCGYTVIALKRNIESVPVIKLTKQPIWIIKEFQDINLSDLNGIDVVIHLAAVGISPRIASWEECMKINYLDTLNFLKLVIFANVRKIIVAGTFAEYGLTAQSKFFLNTNDLLLPLGAYASSKAMLSLALRNLANCNTQISYVRLFSVYGEGQFSGNLWPQLKFSAENGLNFDTTHGEQIRDFIHISEVCTKLNIIIKSDNESLLNFYNIGTGNGKTIKYFVNYWWLKFNANGIINFGKIPYRQNEIMRMVADPDENFFIKN